ncbi:MAG: AtpZ/AtpI family protein [Chloroflexota bacterium]
MKKEEEDFNKSMRQAGPYLNLGLQLVIPIIGGAFLGVWLDGRNNSSPTWALVCSLSGIVIGFYGFFRTIYRNEKQEQSNKRNGK